MNYFTDALKKYAKFEGRTSRKAFWMFVLFNFIFGTCFSYLTRFGLSGLSNLYGLALFIPGLAITVRRLHDINKGGSYLLFLLIPVIGWLYLLILCVQIGDMGENKYGFVDDDNDEKSNNSKNIKNDEAKETSEDEVLKPLE
jgi:uncharacterized membrane protein YhaH (DUF805 family)